MNKIFTDEEALHQAARQLAALCPPGLRLYLSGELGVGKTSFVRAFLQHLGVKEAIKSPTFTLVETYNVDSKIIHHFDLYRLQTAEELEYLGIDDYYSERAIILVEWPEKGQNHLPEPDILCTIYYHASGRRMECGAGSERGQQILLVWDKG